MNNTPLEHHAEHFLAVARRHPECRGGRILDTTGESAILELHLHVELPLHMKVDGVSPNGVQQHETTTVVLDADYPWSTPTFYLRSDFPRDLPHLQPDPSGTPPRPCLVDADQREYFFQFGLIEAGIFHLIQQLVLWLQHAAEGNLIDSEQGWEPTLRHNLASLLMIDAETCRAMVDRRGGFRVFRSWFYRLGPDDASLTNGASVMLHVGTEIIPLKRGNMNLLGFRRNVNGTSGNTVGCLVWPDKQPDGTPFISDRYMPETVTTLADLRQRADELGCGRGFRDFLDLLEQCFQGYFLEQPIPISVILCARRPCHLIGSSSQIELLPYVVDISLKQNRSSVFAAAENEPASPTMQLDVVNPALITRVTGTSAAGPITLLGCGSVGSKLGMHLARSGVEIHVISDRGVLLPHNLIRHALARSPLAGNKAQALAEELDYLGQNPRVHDNDLVAALQTAKGRSIVLPKTAAFAINTTASLGVREALSALPPESVSPRLAEVALFGRGHGGFMLVEGRNHNPTLCDMVSELYATVSTDRLRHLLFDSKLGLREVQIGQGCGSLTMPMTDMRLSAMTAGLTEHLVEELQQPHDHGQIVIGTTEDNHTDTIWIRQTVAAFEVLPIESAKGWTLRISQRVLEMLHSEVAYHPRVETGGVLIGTCNSRLMVVTVVDLLPAPPDSIRSSTRFVLGTSRLQDMIMERHNASGGALFDVGTWHSHLDDQGPSPLDRQTALELGAERPPPAVLLIATPRRYHALMHMGAKS